MPSTSTIPEPTATILLAAKEKARFNGNFSGSANLKKFHLNSSNESGAVKGTLLKEDKNYMLSGQIIGKTFSGMMKWPLGDMPFEAYYYGDNFVRQFDKETIGILKLLEAAATEDAQALFANNKIVFFEE